MLTYGGVWAMYVISKLFWELGLPPPSTLVSVLAAARRNWAVYDLSRLGRFGRRERTLKRASKPAMYSWSIRGCLWNIWGKNLVHNLVHN